MSTSNTTATVSTASNVATNVQQKRALGDQLDKNDDNLSPADEDSKRKKRKDSEFPIKDNSSGNSVGGNKTNTSSTSNQGINRVTSRIGKPPGPASKTMGLMNKTGNQLDRKSESPKMSTVKSPAETVEIENDDLKGNSAEGGPKVPPLKIVIPQQSTSSSNTNETQDGSQSTNQRTNKTTAARNATSGLPYVINSTSNTNENAVASANEKDGTNSSNLTASSTDSNKSNDDSKSASASGKSKEPRILRSSQRSGKDSKDDRSSNNSSPQLPASSTPSPAAHHTDSSVGTESDHQQSTWQTHLNPQIQSHLARQLHLQHLYKQLANSNATTSSNVAASSSSQSSVELHPRKRKIKASSKEPQSSSSSSSASSTADLKDSNSKDGQEKSNEPVHPHDQPFTNCYQMYIDLRKQIQQRHNSLHPIEPRPLKGLEDYLMNRRTYSLQGKTPLEPPNIIIPPLLPAPMKETFVEQEKERHRLKLKHIVEKEKLVLSKEQEILRVHCKAAQMIANQSQPFSVCTMLKDEEVYNIITPEQEEKYRNKNRERSHGRVFYQALKELDDKWDKIKEAMIIRHTNESESLHAVQKMDWGWKLKELALCDYKATPEIEELHVPMVDQIYRKIIKIQLILLKNIIKMYGIQNHGNFRGGFQQNRNGGGNNSNFSDLNSTVLKSVNYENAPPFRKNFYSPAESVITRTPQETQALLSKYEITMKGKDSDVYKPLSNFKECNFPDFITNEINRQGFVEPTSIQAGALPTIMSGRNLVGIAKTGSGKTLAYVLPSLIHLKHQPNIKPNEGPIVLILAPTRELAQQIQSVANDFGMRNNITNVAVFGGAAKSNQIRELSRGCNICIATPGRLIDFLERGVLNLKRCTYLVLDEADRMLDMGFEPQIRKILSQIRSDRQLLMFSATWPNEIQALAKEFLNDYIQINIGSLCLSANHNILQIIDVCDENEKDSKLIKILGDISNENDRKTIVFVETKRRADEISRSINRRGFNAVAIHGDKSQNERDYTLNSFRSGRHNVQILVATDVASRGLDIDVKYVINYDYPNSSDEYIHRIGRTGRNNRTGTAYTFFTDSNSQKANDLINVLREANQIINPRLIEMSHRSFGRKGNMRRNPNGMNVGGMNSGMHMNNKRPRSDNRSDVVQKKPRWDNGASKNDSALHKVSRFSNNDGNRGYKVQQGSNGNNNPSYRANAAYQPQKYFKPGSYDKKPSQSQSQQQHSSMSLTSFTAQSGFTSFPPPMPFAHYAFTAYPPPTTAGLLQQPPPLPKN
ncbi:hypothetical protein PVAND_007057 [Polypedilum vanderplanki]|uniref:RNA helicase n=1 Tax=Polypedilum vanderplanki TaxID=319348 RepID=A0A9J6C621_POLVA|nr:hypothetical protein PVAND_007057 [Polypedilum vanderplanki]